MQSVRKIDLTKLLGFDAVSAEVEGPVDLQDAAIDGRLGAKVGAESWVACEVNGQAVSGSSGE